MKILCIADLQAQCASIKSDMLPQADMLLIAGDLLGWGNIRELSEFNRWLNSLNYKHKVLIAGNHDLVLEGIKGIGKSIFTQSIYLENELIEIEGLRIWGSPFSENDPEYVPYFRAFADTQKSLRLIPGGIDILLTHGPPFGILDKGVNARHLGSKAVEDVVREVRPRYHVFGHIHSGYGTQKTEHTTFVNASLPDDYNVLFTKQGELLHKPIVLSVSQV